MLVYVPKGVTVDEPLKATFTIAEHGAAQQWRVLVIAEESSRVAFMEEHAEGLPGYANGVAELHVGRERQRRVRVVPAPPPRDAALRLAPRRGGA